ncbi:hypothetical protein N9033_01080, partial [bacterium]|nr:hypothetical protein [bacterium]
RLRSGVLELPRSSLEKKFIWPVLGDEKEIREAILIDVSDCKSRSGGEIIPDVFALEEILKINRLDASEALSSLRI